MKRTILLMTLMITLGSLFGCEVVRQESSSDQSRFKQNFSLGSIVINHSELLLEGPLASSGMEAGPRAPFTQSQEYMTVPISPENTTALLTSIQSDMQDSLSEYGANILGSSGNDKLANPIAYFSINYSEGSFYGTVNIWGVRGEGNTLILISEITESRTQNE